MYFFGQNVHVSCQTQLFVVCQNFQDCPTTCLMSFWGLARYRSTCCHERLLVVSEGNCVRKLTGVKGHLLTEIGMDFSLKTNYCDFFPNYTYRYQAIMCSLIFFICNKERKMPSFFYISERWYIDSKKMEKSNSVVVVFILWYLLLYSFNYRMPGIDVFFCHSREEFFSCSHCFVYCRVLESTYVYLKLGHQQHMSTWIALFVHAAAHYKQEVLILVEVVVHCWIIVFVSLKACPCVWFK